MSTSNTIIETLSQCSYQPNVRDYIAGVLLEITNFSKTAKFFKVNKNGDNIIVIKYNILTAFKDRQFDIPVLIYICKNFPYEAPEIYVEKTSDTGISPKNTDIDSNSNKIYVPALKKWNINSRLPDVIGEITTSFNLNFPIYKINKPSTSNIQRAPTIYSDLGINNNQGIGYNNGNISYQPNFNQISYNPYQPYNYNQQGVNSNDAPGVFGKDNNPNINSYVQPGYNQTGNNSQTGFNGFNNSQGGFNQTGFNQGNTGIQPGINQTGFNQGGFNPNSLQGSNQQLNQLNNNTQNINKSKTNFWEQSYVNPSNNNLFTDKSSNNTLEEELAKRKIVEDLKPNLEVKVKEELKRLKQQEDKLKNFYSEFISQTDKYIKFMDKKDEIMFTLKGLLDKIQFEINNVNTILLDSKDKVINQQNSFSFISIKDKDTKLIQILAIESTIDDILAVLKKSFEKNILNFSDTVKLERNLTREAFKIKFYREKLLLSY